MRLRRHFPPLLLLVLFPAATIGGQKPISVDAQDRAAVVAFFRDVYEASEGVSSGFTGNASRCSPGTISSAYRRAGLLRIAYFRAMAGLSAEMALSSDWSKKCQAAALMMASNQKLSHSPSSSWNCYTRAGAEAARNSNLGSGYPDLPTAVTGWILDRNTPTAGHRRWLLYPPQATVGIGAFTGGEIRAYALWVNGGGGTRPSSPKWVAWPPPGYVPYQVVGALWSFSYADADFSETEISVSREDSRVAIRKETLKNGFGDNTVCWTLRDYSSVPPGRDIPYRVTVRNVRIGGVPTNFAYDVTVIDPARRPGAPK